MSFDPRSSAGVTKVQFTLGSGDTREQLFANLTRLKADVGGNWSLGKNTRQLANIAFKADEQQSPETTFDQLVDAIAEFIKQHAETYQTALTALTTDDGADEPFG